MANTEKVNVEFLTGPLDTMLNSNNPPQGKEGAIYFAVKKSSNNRLIGKILYDYKFDGSNQIERIPMDNYAEMSDGVLTEAINSITEDETTEDETTRFYVGGVEVSGNDPFIASKKRGLIKYDTRIYIENGSLKGNLNGNASTASKWENACTFSVGNQSQQQVEVDGSSDVILPITVTNTLELALNNAGYNLKTTVNGATGSGLIPWNSKNSWGVLPQSGENHNYHVWGTDGQGNPGWQDNRRAAPEYKDFLIRTSDWQNKICTLSDDRITANSVQIITYAPSSKTSTAMRKVIDKAGLIDAGDQTNGQFKIEALGTVPTMDIYLRIFFLYTGDDVAYHLTSAAASAMAATQAEARVSAQKMQVKAVTLTPSDLISTSVDTGAHAGTIRYYATVTWTGVKKNDWVDIRGYAGFGLTACADNNTIRIYFQNNEFPSWSNDSLDFLLYWMPSEYCE